MISPDPRRPEPFGCTLGDLIALTLGAAIAASLDWYSGSPNAVNINGRAAPNWYVSANHVIELLQKGCVALIPVIVYRGWRYGRPIRPAEYLPMLTGLSQIAYSTSKWPIFGLTYKAPNPPHMTLVNIEAYHVWELSEIAIGLVAALLFSIRRRRVIDWLAGVFLAIAWTFLTASAGFVYQQWANDRIAAMGASFETSALLSTVLVQGPQYLIGWMPLAITLIEMNRPPSRRRPWIEWVAFASAVPLVFLYEARFHAHRMIARSSFNFANAVDLSAKVITFGLSYALARGSEPAWRRLLGASPPGQAGGPEARASEVVPSLD